MGIADKSDLTLFFQSLNSVLPNSENKQAKNNTNRPCLGICTAEKKVIQQVLETSNIQQRLPSNFG